MVIRKIWNTFIKFMVFKTLQIGYSSSISSSSFESGISDESESSETDDKTINITHKPSIRKTMFIYNPENENKTSKEKGMVQFLIDNIPYVDIELISKMIKTITNVIRSEEDGIKKKITCCFSEPFVPVIIIDDVIIYNQSTLVNGQKIKSIALQIKASIIPHKQQKTSFTMSRLNFTIDSIISDILHVQCTPDISSHISSYDINNLKNMVNTLFTDEIIDDILTHEIDIIRCVDKQYITKKDCDLSTHCENMIKTCDVVFIVEDYTTLYMNAIIDKYIKLFIDHSHAHHHSALWKMAFLGMEHDIKNKYSTNDNIIIAFNYVGESEILLGQSNGKKHNRTDESSEDSRRKRIK
jgi:hypothetical protein